MGVVIYHDKTMINKTCKLSFVLVFFAALAVNSCFAQDASKSGKGNMPPTVVKTYDVKQQNWQDSIVVVGSLSAFNGVLLSSEISGRITSVNVHEGQNVKKGDLLIEIYPDIVQAQLQKDKAQLVYNQKTYERYLALAGKGYVSQSDLDNQKAQLDMNKAAVASDMANLKQHYITAPFSGRLGVTKISLGDYVNSGTELVSLQQLDPIRVDFNIPDSYLSQIKKGDQVEISSKAFAQKYTGTIYALDSVVDTDTRTLAARAKVPNPGNTLVPGTYVQVVVRMLKPQATIVIPQIAIVYSSSGDFVYLMTADHKALKTSVTLGDKIADGLVIVNKGLKVGDMVITEGQMKLFDGSPVMTVDEYQQMAKTASSTTPAKK